MKIIATTFIQIALAAAVVFSAAAPANARTPLEKHLKNRGYVLPNIISYNDLYDTAYSQGVVDIEKMLAEHDTPIIGEGDSRYVRKSDLLKICGKDCNYHMGWGIFLSEFAVQEHRK